MAISAKYFITDQRGNYIDWSAHISGFSLLGKEVQLNGGAGDDALYVQAGTSADITNMGGGINTLYLTGGLADYTQTIDQQTGVYTFTRTAGLGGGQSEVVKLTVADKNDVVYFADGHLTINAVTDARLFDVGTATYQAIQSGWLTAGGSPTSPVTTAATQAVTPAKVFIEDAQGLDVPALMQPGQAMEITGSGAVDTVYINAGTSVDASNLGGGNDRLYLLGSLAEYTQTIDQQTGVYTLTRNAGGQNEMVKFTVGDQNDVVYFADGHLTINAVTDTRLFDVGTTTYQTIQGGWLTAGGTPLPGPSLTITTNANALKAGDVATLTFTLSEAPGNGTTFVALDDVVVTGGGTLSALTQVSSTVYTATFTPATNSTTPVTVSVAGGAFSNAAGQNNVAAQQLSMAVDTIAPVAATIDAVATDDMINLAERTAGVTVTGTNEAGATVTLNGNAVTALTGTTWSYNLSTAAIDAFGQGAETLTVISTDAAGNATTSTRSITVDTVAPTLSSSTPVDNEANAFGNSIVLTFSENVAAGLGNIVISDGTNTANIAVTDPQVAISGNVVTVTPTAGFAAGQSYNVQMASGVIVDSLGNAYAGIADATTLNFTVTTNPTVQITTNDSALKIGDTALLTFTLSGVSTNFIASDIVVSGGGTLSSFSGSGSSYTAVFTPAANSTTPVTVDIAAGAFTVGANSSLAAVQLGMAVDTVAPTVAITSAALTKLALPVVSGTAEAGATVTAAIDGATYTTIATGGNWSVNTATATPTSGTLALNVNGVNAVSVTAVDAAGNPTAAATTQTLTIDTTAPAGAVISAVAGNDIINASERVAGVTVTGTNEAGATVTLNGNAVTAVSGTSWSYALTSTAIDAFGQGAETLTVVSTDAAGNVTSATKAITVDTVAPVVTITSAALTKVAAPVVSGTVEAGATITAVIAGATYTTTATNGTWSVNTATATPTSGTLALNVNGNNSVSVTAVDTAGNQTAAAATQTLAIDTTAPVAATIDMVATNDVIDASERAAGVTVTGTNEAGATVTLNGNAVTALSGTTWSYALTSTAIDAFGQGAETLTVVSTDAAGNATNSTRAITVSTRSVSYSATTFQESSANDGSITTTSTITLIGDTFAGTTGQALVGASVTNVPVGLTAVVTKTGATTATLALTGNAVAHANVNDIANLTVVLGDSTFTLGNAAAVIGANKSDFVVDFDVVVPRSVSYDVATFVEAVANDGSISTTSTITLSGDTFLGTNGQALTGATVSNVPVGLTAVVTKTSSTTATLTLTGNAAAHANANDISNLTVVLGDSAFALGNAAGVTGSTKSNLVVDFNDLPPRSVSYNATTFVEAAANDGSISTTSTITLSGDTFAGTTGQALPGATVTNVPVGLTAVVTKTGSTTATLTLTGNAASHANANDIANLTVVLGDSSFTLGNAASVTGSNKSNLVVDFNDLPPRSMSYSTWTFNEASANDGSIATVATITLTGDTFTGTTNAVMGGVTFSNVPSGLTAVVTKTGANTATLSLSGSAVAHVDASDISNLTVTFGDGAFALGNAASVTSSTVSTLAVNYATSITNGTTVGNTLLGTAGSDIIYGLGGPDTINGLAGNDTIDITDTGTTAFNSATIGFTSTANGLDSIEGFSAAATANGGDVLDFSTIVNLTDSVATGQTLATNFGANNVFVFNATPVAIVDAAAAIAADASVVATAGYIVIADSANHNAVTVYHSTDLAANGTETALAILSGVNIDNLTAANFIV